MKLYISEATLRTIEKFGSASLTHISATPSDHMSIELDAAPLATEASKPAPSVEQDERGACDRYQVLNEAGEALLAANHGEAYEVIYRMMKDARAASTSANVASKPAEIADCPHAAPHRYCYQCVVSPCPIGLGEKK